MSKTYTEMRELLVAAFKTIKTANGYSTELPDDHFYSNYEAAKIRKGPAADYPKVFITFSDSKTVNATGRRKEKEATFFVTIVVLEQTGDGGLSTPADEQIEAVADDVEKMCVAQYNLGGEAVSVSCDSVSMDSGFAHPEGIGIFEIVVKWHKQY